MAEQVLDGPVEIGGLMILQHEEKIDVYDRNYGIFIGHLVLEEGPGWVLEPSKRSTFLDIAQMRSLVEFADEHLKLPETRPCSCGASHTLSEEHQLGMVCGRCEQHTGNNNQGHYWAMCKVLLRAGKGVEGSIRDYHFCCPDNCELEADNANDT